VLVDTISDRVHLCALVEKTCQRKVLFNDDCQAVNNAFFEVRDSVVGMQAGGWCPKPEKQGAGVYAILASSFTPAWMRT
jgi:hypothetical protein